MGRNPLPEDKLKKRVTLFLTADEEAEIRSYLQWLRQQAESVGGGEQ